MRKAVVTVYGDVQRVGYRYLVQDVARRVGVKGYVQNLPDGSVKIVAEGSQESVNRFVAALNVKEPPITVEKVDSKYARATGEFGDFRVRYGRVAEELAEGFGSGLQYIVQVRDEVRGLRSETREGFVLLDQKYGAISETLKQLSRDFRSLKEAIERYFERKGISA